MSHLTVAGGMPAEVAGATSSPRPSALYAPICHRQKNMAWLAPRSRARGRGKAWRAGAAMELSLDQPNSASLKSPG